MESGQTGKVVAEAEGPTRGGYFTGGGRSAAIAAALLLISSYFVSGRDRHQLEVSPTALGSETEQNASAAGIAALRLRAALVAAGRLADIADSVLIRPNFRYEISRFDSIGVLAGQLDTARWISRQREVAQPDKISDPSGRAIPANSGIKLAVKALSILH